jgi:hypothetical protein
MAEPVEPAVNHFRTRTLKDRAQTQIHYRVEWHRLRDCRTGDEVDASLLIDRFGYIELRQVVDMQAA